LLDQFDWSVSEPTVRFARLDRSPNLNDLQHWTEPTLSIDASGKDLLNRDDLTPQQSLAIPLRAAKINHRQAARFMAQVQRDVRSNIMFAPKMTMFNGQCGLITDVVQRPFVTDVVEIVGEKATAFEPKVSVFDDGRKILLKPTVTADHEVKLNMVFTQSSVDGVKLANLPNGPGRKPDERITIQVPTVLSDSIAIESVLKKSETLLVFSPTAYSDQAVNGQSIHGAGMGQVFLIRIRLISDSDFLKSFVPNRALKPNSESEPADR